uniref:Obg domain-containing protein n=1 Tax=Parascaris equorum TaxID=6256 RepID=A0A914R7U8_PAREQ
MEFVAMVVCVPRSVCYAARRCCSSSLATRTLSKRPLLPQKRCTEEGDSCLFHIIVALLKHYQWEHFDARKRLRDYLTVDDVSVRKLQSHRTGRCWYATAKDDEGRDWEAASFVDFRRVTCKAGNGGNGMVSFFRGFRVPYGGPDGGDGGHGAHVILQADESVKDLSRLNSVITAKNGEYGKPKSCHGKNAKHLIVKVPLGTVVKQINSNIVSFTLVDV